MTTTLPELGVLAGPDAVLDGELVVGGGWPNDLYRLAGRMARRSAIRRARPEADGGSRRPCTRATTSSCTV